MYIRLLLGRELYNQWDNWDINWSSVISNLFWLLSYHAFASVYVCLTFSCFADCFFRNVVPSTGPSSSSAPRRCQVLGMDCQYTWSEMSQRILHGHVYRLALLCGVCCPASMHLLQCPQTDMATEHLWAWNIKTEPHRGLGSNRPCSKITMVNYMCTENFAQKPVCLLWRLAFRSVLCQAER